MGRRYGSDPPAMGLTPNPPTPAGHAEVGAAAEVSEAAAEGEGGPREGESDGQRGSPMGRSYGSDRPAMGLTPNPPPPQAI